MKQKRRLLFWLMFAAVLGWGIFVRSWGLGGRSLWMDEAAVANLIMNSSWSQLLSQTDLPVAPMFAIGAKLTGTLISSQEIGLRLLPMICGIACVLLVYLVMRTLRFGRMTSLVGMALCASSPWLVIWSRELKQYEIEAFFSVLLALLVLRLRRCTKTRNRWFLGVGIAAICLLGPWFGYGLIFPATSMMFILILLRPVFGSRRITVITGIVGLCVLAGSVVLILHLVVAEQASQKALVSFMSPNFITLTSLRSWMRAGAYGAASSVMLILPFYDCVANVGNIGYYGGAIWFLVLFGLWRWPRQSRLEMTCWVIIPWLLLLAAALAHRYPFAAVRMTVFLAPPMALAVAMAVVRFCRWCSKLMSGRNGPGIAAALIIVLLPVLYMINVPMEHKYWVNHDFREVVRVLKQKRGSNEVVVVALDAVQPVRFYAVDEDKNFKYVPCIGGTRPVPGYNYTDLVQHLLRNAGKRWWLLTTSLESDPTRKLLMSNAPRWGYKAELVAEAGGQEYGAAQLFSFVRSNR